MTEIKQLLVKPIPLFYPKNYCGCTGFLMRRDGRVWLVTALHLLSRQDETPTSFSLPDFEIHVLNKDITIKGPAKAPHLVLIEHAPTKTWMDIMAIPLSAHVQEALASFGSYDVGDVVPAEIGEELDGFGFPEISNASTEIGTLSGRITRAVGPSLALSVPSRGGFSGGFMHKKGDSRALVAMIHGNVEKVNPSVGLAMNLHFLQDYLFM